MSQQPRYAFLIGAAKCGTTSLADMLNEHEDICVSDPKEPDFFAEEQYGKGFEWYEKCFSRSKNCKYRLDASVYYSTGWNKSSPGIAERISQFAPDAKIVYVVRDPIERTRASYWHAIRSGYEHHTLWDAIHNSASHHITASRYSERIDEYRKYFPEENILVIPTSELYKNTRSVLSRVTHHLDIQDFGSVEVKKGTNKTYQLSAIGKALHILLPRNVIKTSIKKLKQTLPDSVVSRLYDLYTRPIPDLSAEEASYLASIFENEVSEMKMRYGFDLRTSKWWPTTAAPK